MSLCQPQNSLPDVVIWMLCGSKRIAYIRVPAYEVLYSQRRKDACGRFCGRTFGYFLKVWEEKFTVILFYFQRVLY